ncbi:MAG: hypothetical protein ACLTSZ_17175 [Lachnospiraceae bacterium]
MKKGTEGLVRRYCFAKAELIIFNRSLRHCGADDRTALKSKTEDPAVLVLDEAGQYVISLLSGHIGGAMRTRKRLQG